MVPIFCVNMDCHRRDSPDIWAIILSHINCGSTYKAIYLTDSVRRDFVRKAHPDADTRFANQLLTFFDVVCRTNIVPKGFHDMDEFVEFIFANMSGHVAARHILANPERPWAAYALAINPNITIEVVKTLGRHKFYDWVELSCNSGIIIEDMLANPDMPWKWGWISSNPNLTMTHILANPSKPWDWEEISSLPKIYMKDIEAYPDLPWVWRFISDNPNITGEFVLANIDQNWDFYRLSKNPGITVEFITTNPDLPWDWEGVSRNPNVTDEFVAVNPNKRWCYCGLADNPGISEKFKRDHSRISYHMPILQNNYDEQPTAHQARKLLFDIRVTWKKMVELLLDN